MAEGCPFFSGHATKEAPAGAESCPHAADQGQGQGQAIERSAPRVTYTNYLNLETLLSLQSGEPGCPRSISNDEQHFIIVHQVFELWFKVVLTELRCARDLLNSEKVEEVVVPQAVHHMRRVTEIFRLMANQWRVMETLVPQDFLEFREHLGTSSGFQSWQMRDLEIVLGLRSHARMKETDPLMHFKHGATTSEEGQRTWDHLQKTLDEESLAGVVTKWMQRTPIRGSLSSDPNDEAVVSQFVEDYVSAYEGEVDAAMNRLLRDDVHMDEEAIRARFARQRNSAREWLMPEGAPIRSRVGLLFIESYRHLPLLTWPRQLLDAVVELEESMVLWRASHARMVERIIGRRTGSGGSSGVDYLDNTTKYRVFTDLWQVRTILVKRAALPPLAETSFYGFFTAEAQAPKE